MNSFWSIVPTITFSENGVHTVAREPGPRLTTITSRMSAPAGCKLKLPMATLLMMATADRQKQVSETAFLDCAKQACFAHSI